jgi:hypothetical protein
MSNREVAGLQALARKHGGQLSVNPDTGLPEAGFLDNILPAVAGGALTAFTGIDPVTAGAIVGGITALDSKDLSKGLVAGLGAYGGSSMYTGLAGAGLGAVGADLSANAAANAAGQGLTGEAYNQAVQNEVATQLAEKNLASEGVSQLFSNPGQTLATMGGGNMLQGGLPILAGLAPAAVEAFDAEEDEDMPPEQKGYIRKYELDPVTGQYKQVGVYEAGGDPNKDVTSKAGTAGAFGAVGQSEYEAAQGMAEGGATDSSRVYDYLLGRGPNPMQFTHTQRPQVDYNVNKPDAPITPTTQILEQVYDPYGNRTGGGGMDADQRAEREKAYNTPQDYLTVERYDPETKLGVKDAQSPASLAALGSGERAMHMQGVRLQSPIRTAVSDVITNVGIIPIGAKILDSIMHPFGKPVNLDRAPVEDRTTYKMDVENDLQRQQEATQKLRENAAEGLGDSSMGRVGTPGGPGSNEGGGYGGAAGRGDDSGSGQSGSGGWGRGATGGLATNYGIEHMAHGGIANLAQRYDSGGMTLPLKAQPIKNLGSMHPKTLQAAYDRAVSTNDVAGARKYKSELGLREKFKNPQMYADGGETGEYNLGSYSDGGRLLKGPGDGVSDDIPATIGNGQPARLADGEFVIPARIVSELGNGSTDAGARELYKMMDRIQAGRKKTVGKDQVAKNSKAVRHLPA